jgi:hypothetical protein
MSLLLRGHPDWHGAAEVLIEGCAHLPTEEARVRWMERLCLTLGDALYPAFLKVLCHVGEHADPGAQQAVAETLVSAMASGRLPSGRHMAWGSARGGGVRDKGPVEFLCAWYAQPEVASPLPVSAFDRAARALLSLVSHSDSAKQLYCTRLLADAEDPLDGHWPRATRQALRVMARAWQKASLRDTPEVVDVFLRALRAVPSQPR